MRYSHSEYETILELFATEALMNKKEKMNQNNLTDFI